MKLEMLNAPDFLNTYLNLTKAKFKDEPHLDHFITEMSMAFASVSGNASAKFYADSDACVALVPSLTEPTNANFGFMALSKEDSINQRLWDALKAECQSMGIDKISGPIQGSTYFPYRFVIASDGSPFFKGEYFSTPSDHAFMMKQHPEQCFYYRSGYRNYFDGIMKVSEPYYQKAIEAGLEVRMHPIVTETLFQEVSPLIDQIFGGNWSFQQLEPEALKALYQHEFGSDRRLSLHTFHFKGELIGFCRYVENDANTLICKTLGLLPQYQKMGLGNAGVYQMHADAKKAGYERMIYALIFDGNRVQQNMPKDDSIIFRKYASYEFRVT